MDQPPHSTEKAIGALDAGIAPLQILLGRRRKEGKQAGRVGAIGGDEMLGIHDVLLRLRHLLYAALHDRRADLHSLTLRAPPPLLVGPHHFTGTKVLPFGKGEAPLPEKGTSLGSMTGRSASGTGTVPHASQ